MNRKQRNQSRATALDLADEVFEANLPDGLTLRGGELQYECPSCGRDREWFGDDVRDFDPSSPCGQSEWCLP